MKKSIKNINEEVLDIDIIRYFENNGSEYLIYSLNENVGDDYIKLYASKIIGNSACIIDDNSEWLLIKEIVKDIIKSNHEGLTLNVLDLDENELVSITLQDTRVFKLQGNLVNLLADNKMVNKKEEPVIIEPDEPEEDLEEELEIENSTEELFKEEDYQELYLEEMAKNKILEEKINDLQEKIVNYQTMIDKIKNFIEE